MYPVVISRRIFYGLEQNIIFHWLSVITALDLEAAKMRRIAPQRDLPAVPKIKTKLICVNSKNTGRVSNIARREHRARKLTGCTVFVRDAVINNGNGVVRLFAEPNGKMRRWSRQSFWTKLRKGRIIIEQIQKLGTVLIHFS